jgi:hypothetical protein
MAFKYINSDHAADSTIAKHCHEAVEPYFDDCDLKTLAFVGGNETRTLLPQEMASWVGRPSVKGSTETTRMMLLTFSLVGLQYVYRISANRSPLTIE